MAAARCSTAACCWWSSASRAGVWALTLAGACLVAAAVGWHGASLIAPAAPGAALPVPAAGALLRRRRGAACPVGAGLGAALARGLADPLHDRLTLAHVAVNVLGWMGLTVVGTLVTLWPTMLRTRIAAGAERAARRALPVLLGAVVVTAAGGAGRAHLARRGGRAGLPRRAGRWSDARSSPPRARSRPRRTPPGRCSPPRPGSPASLIALAVAVASAPSWSAVGTRLDALAVPLAAGFGAQVLLGALSYLIPVVLGGGPAPCARANAELERAGALRITLVNGGPAALRAAGAEPGAGAVLRPRPGRAGRLPAAGVPRRCARHAGRRPTRHHRGPRDEGRARERPDGPAAGWRPGSPRSCSPWPPASPPIRPRSSPRSCHRGRDTPPARRPGSRCRPAACGSPRRGSRCPPATGSSSS